MDALKITCLMEYSKLSNLHLFGGSFINVNFFSKFSSVLVRLAIIIPTASFVGALGSDGSASRLDFSHNAYSWIFLL